MHAICISLKCVKPIINLLNDFIWSLDVISAKTLRRHCECKTHWILFMDAWFLEDIMFFPPLCVYTYWTKHSFVKFYTDTRILPLGICMLTSRIYHKCDLNIIYSTFTHKALLRFILVCFGLWYKLCPLPSQQLYANVQYCIHKYQFRS